MIKNNINIININIINKMSSKRKRASDIDENGNVKDLIDYEYEKRSKRDNEDDLSDNEEDFDEDADTEEEYDEKEDEEYNDEEYNDEEYNDNEDEYHQKNIGMFLNSLLGMPPTDKKTQVIKLIDNSKLSTDLKDKLKKKLATCQLDEKQEDWFKTFLNIPFEEYTPPAIDINSSDIGLYFKNLMQQLDKTVYGLKNVKEEIINYVAQCITTTTPSPRILALHGAAGVGKTKIIREGISKALGRPMQSFSMGGLKDSSHFVGFDYTYSNSKYGSIVQSLLTSGVMNPIFFFDELDKISSGNEGEEIENLLIHMTDPVQNHQFRDKYFDGFPIDLSKVIFIFAFNDINNVNPILKDRLHIINIPSPTEADKIIIAKQYLIDELLKNIGLQKTDFDINDKALEIIVKQYSNSDGIRNIKRCIETVLLKINTIKLLGNSIKDIKLSFSSGDCSLPVKINENNINMFLSCHKKEENLPKYPYMYI